jgi:GTPase SAR1 family protein
MNLKKIMVFIFSIFMMLNFSALVMADFARVLIIGDYRGGKTQIWNRIHDLGYNADELRNEDFQGFLLQIGNNHGDSIRVWDTPGMGKYRSDVINSLNQNTNFIFIVHDLSQKYVEDSTAGYIDGMYREIHERAPNANIVFIGSKSDLRFQNLSNYSKNLKMLEELSHAAECKLIISSAQNDVGKYEPNDGVQRTVQQIIIHCITQAINNPVQLSPQDDTVKPVIVKS